MNKIIYLLLLLSYLLATCDEFYVEIDDNCYHEDDIEFLQGLIDNSQSGENPPQFPRPAPEQPLRPLQ